MKEKDLTYENKAVKLYKFPGRTWEDLLGPNANKKIQKKFVKILKDNPFESYYLESPDISTNPPLEFVLVESETLHKKKADWSMYKEYMKKSTKGKGKSRTSTSFDNLSGEFRLIIPLNKKLTLQYGHLADFMRNASPEEIDDILLEVGRQLEKYRKKKGPIYFSTHGDGVPWIHFRIGRVLG